LCQRKERKAIETNYINFVVTKLKNLLMETGLFNKIRYNNLILNSFIWFTPNDRDIEVTTVVTCTEQKRLDGFKPGCLCG
ncbi:hypothetical protein NPIL_348131, partial [Nephila pilipes]